MSYRLGAQAAEEEPTAVFSSSWFRFWLAREGAVPGFLVEVAEQQASLGCIGEVWDSWTAGWGV